MATLEERVRRLEDVQLIADLTMELAHQFDNGYHADGIRGPVHRRRSLRRWPVRPL